MATLNLSYYRREVYGKSHMYLIGGTEASAVERLTGKLTLTDRDKASLETLGLSFTETLAPMRNS